MQEVKALVWGIIPCEVDKSIIDDCIEGDINRKADRLIVCLREGVVTSLTFLKKGLLL